MVRCWTALYFATCGQTTTIHFASVFSFASASILVDYLFVLEMFTTSLVTKSEGGPAPATSGSILTNLILLFHS